MSRVAGLFDRAAETYDAVGVPWFGPIAAGLVAELAPAPGERALDLGCGRGAATRPLAEAVGATGSVLAVDAAPGMVRRTAADLAHLPHVQVREADVSALDLPAASYDLVAASLVLFFLPDPAAAVRDWAALLAPGGRLGVSTFGEQDPTWRTVDEVFLPYLPQQLKDARTSGRSGPFATDEGVEELLRGAGLVDVRTLHLDALARFADREQWLAFSWSHGQRGMWEHVPPERRDEVRDAAYALLDEGGLALGQDVRLTVGSRPGDRAGQGST